LIIQGEEKMTRSSSNQKEKRAPNRLQEAGFAACVIGAAMLISPALVGKSALLTPLALALRPIGWLALAGGAVMIAIHHLLKKKTGEEKPSLSSNLKEPNFTRDIRQELAYIPKEPSKPSPKVRELATQWSTKVFADIEWRRFEAVCERLFAQAGFETKSQSHGADGGIDIWLFSKNAKGPVSVVQCKHWQGKPVSVKEMREFLGVMTSQKLTRGTYATTSTYTADAEKFAKDNNINALNAASLLDLIAKRTPEQQQELLQVAYEGDYWRPTCASCGIKMVERSPSKGGAQFWGCSSYPKCKSRLPMVAALR
jgi:restriction system protein